MKDWQRNAAMALMIAGLLWCAPALAQMGGHDMSGMGKKDSDQSMDMGKKDKGGKDGMSGHGMGHVFGPGWMETLTDDQKKKAEEMHLQLKKDLSTLEAAKGLRKAELDLLVLQDNPGARVEGRADVFVGFVHGHDDHPGTGIAEHDVLDRLGIVVRVRRPSVEYPSVRRIRRR